MKEQEFFEYLMELIDKEEFKNSDLEFHETERKDYFIFWTPRSTHSTCYEVSRVFDEYERQFDFFIYDLEEEVYVDAYLAKQKFIKNYLR